MKRGWIIALLLVPLVALTAFTEEVIVGPEGDPYWLEIPTDGLLPAPPLLQVVTANNNDVDTVILSQFDCGQFPTMCAYIDVLDDDGIPIGGMDADSFCVYQDGSPITGFTVEEITQDFCPTSVCLVIDVSGSMNDGNKINAARNAAHNFVDNMDIYDRVAIVTFSSCYNIVQAFTSDQSLLHSKINTISANGYTAAFDGIYKGVELTLPELGSKAVIAISDGMENYSQHCSAPPDGLSYGNGWWSWPDPDGWTDDSTLIVNLSGGAVPIYTISLGSQFDPDYLVKLAAATGGSYNHAPTGGDISFIYEQIKVRICSRYLICYESPDVVQDGDWHSMQICRRDDQGACGPCDLDSCQETATPVVVRTSPTIDLESQCQPWDQAIQICADVTDLDDDQEDLTVSLFYRNDTGDPYTSVPMTHTGTTYCASIPASAITCATDIVQYYITASDGSTTVSSPPLAPQNFYEIDICDNQPPVVFAGDDMTISQCSFQQICWPASVSDPDGNLASSQIWSGPGTFNGSQICFTPTGSLDYEIVLKAIDDCGLISFDTVVIHYSVNAPPVANAGANQTLFLCAPQEICWPAGCSDANGNLVSCDLTTPYGAFDGSQICFTPTASGVYNFTLRAEDACGAVHSSTATLNITLNSAPVCQVPNDTAIFQCTPTQVCLPVGATDVDGNLKAAPCQIVTGPGSLVGGQWCYTPTGDQVVTVVVRCEDVCDAYCEDQFTVTFDVNNAPNISFGADYAAKLCAPEEICLPFTASDPNAPQATTVTLLSGGGTLDLLNSQVCFTPTGAGDYSFVIQIADSCGVTDTDDITVSVSYNTAPVASAGADQTLFLCAPEAICWPASCSDVDGNLSSCTLIAGPGTYNGSEICFTPSASGNYTFTLQATDACGATHTDDVVISVTMNSAPTVVAQADLDVSLCAGEEVCVTYTPGDPDGLAGLTETMISGFGSIDPVNDRICFTPTVSGSYEFVVGVTDPCGETAQDIVVVNVTIGASATITCPADPININLCSVTEVCQMVAVQPSTASVQVSMGTYVNGSHCFTPTASGTYNVRIIATKACGADTCDLVYNVDIGQAADIECPAPQDLFICEAGQVCIPVTVAAPGATFVVAPIGYYNNGSVCFEADTSGHYVIDISATTPCGSDACQIIADITINSAPVAADPATPVDLFLCNAQQVCYQFAATDVDGGALTWSKLSGNGTISAGGEWCFNAAADGAYTVIAKVTDACGATDQVTLTYNVDLNSAPVVTLPADLTTFLCEGQPYCFNYSESDVDDNLASAVLLQGPGTLDPQSQEVCFTPTAGGTYTFVVEVTDECGATDQDAINITIQQGTPVTVSCPGNDAVFLCEPEELCYPVTVSHPDAMVTVSPVGSYDYVTGEVCFTPDVAGPYTLTVQASNPCGIASCQFTVDVTFNSAPVADDPSTPIDMFLCVAQQVCYQFTATDVDGGALTWSKVSGNGTVSAGGEWCFNATADGSYSVVAKVTDACGATDQVTLTYNIDLNAAPVVTLPADITTFLCEGQPFCLPYSSTDVDGNLVSTVLIQGPGTLDPQTGEICFTPATSGTYAFVVEATDACGATDQDAINVTIQLGSAVSVTCPGDDAVTLCAPEELCYPITVSHPDATVTVSPLGSYDSQTGEVCFTPSAAGSYTLTVEATNSCGSASCEFTVDVSLNSPPVAVDPGGPFDAFQCETQLICYQFSATDIDGGDLTWTRISGAGAVGTDGRWCFAPSATGQYSVVAEVADECGLTDQVSLTYNVVMNTPPVVAFEADASAFICEPTELCYGYTVADAEDNVVSETLLSGAATLDPVNNTICFTANAAGVFTFVIQVDDACGGTDTDEIVVTVTENRPPVASAGADQNLFLCGPSEVCFGVACSDPDNNLTTCELVSGPGVLDNGQVCFTPSAAGVYDFVIRATDECGLTAEDAVQVTVTMNSSPICQAIGDQSYFQCDPTEVSVPITVADPDDNFDHCEIVSGPGSIVNGAWVYTPAASETRTVIIRCLDECGAFCEQQFTAVFVINAAPVADAGPNLTVFKCNPGEQVCWPAGCTDVDDNLESCNLQGTGTLAGGDICFHPSAEGNYRFILTAVDECGKTDVDSVWITVSFNEPPVIDIPDHLTIFRDEPGQVCFGIDMYDNDNHPFYYELTSGDGVIANNQICFEATGSGDYCFEVRAWDECGAETTAAGCVEVEIDECLNVQIEEVPDVIQGHQRAIDVMLNGSGKPLGGYDLLISYDASALVALAARPGDLFESCGWEYFTYRLGAQGQCDGCPSGLLRITAIADINNGAYHPGCYWQSQVGSIATIDFLVTNDRTLECQFAPVRFFWMDCEDNGFSSVAGDTLWLAREVFDYSGTNITNASYGFPGYFGPLDSCMLGGDMSKSTPMRCVDFTNGGFDIICADSIDARGDLNLNGLAHEIADAVTYTNYFLHGLDAFTVSVEGQIAASDVNADGVTLTVGDLVYLIRVIIGDAPAVPKQVPDVERVVELARMGDALIIGKSSQPVGALHLVIDGEITPVLSARATGMDLQYHFDGSKTRILVFDEDGLLSLGEGPVLTLGRHAVVEKVEAGSFDGLPMVARLAEVPYSFELHQSYPNPFNPTATIRFGLPTPMSYRLVIYNIIGQTVKVWEGEGEVGYTEIVWDASANASGVYFYRLTAGSFSESKKMILLK
jgi:hypothetical protein